MQESPIVQRILECGVIAVMRAPNPEGLVEAAEAIVAGGIPVVEFSLNTPNAPQLIRVARERFGEQALVGAGTILNASDAQRVVDAGAQFIFMPILDQGASEVARQASVPVVPGAFTPTEIVAAWNLSAGLVKLFPASVGGPAYIKAIRGPLPQIRLVPTGGVSAANAGAYIRAGAVAVAVGGNLVDSGVIAAGQYQRLTARAEQLRAAVVEARGENRA